MSVLQKEQENVKVDLSVPKTEGIVSTKSQELSETICQQDSKSEAGKEDLMVAADVMNSGFIIVILLLLVIPRLLKKATSGVNCMMGVLIIGITIMLTIFIGNQGLEDYLNESPYTLAIMLCGVSLGVNLVSHYLTEQVIEPQKEASPVITSKPAILDANIDAQINKLTWSLKQAINLSETLADLQRTTEAQCKSYKKELEHIKTTAENALHKNELPIKQEEESKKEVDAKKTE